MKADISRPRQIDQTLSRTTNSVARKSNREIGKKQK